MGSFMGRGRGRANEGFGDLHANNVRNLDGNRHNDMDADDCNPMNRKSLTFESAGKNPQAGEGKEPTSTVAVIVTLFHHGGMVHPKLLMVEHREKFSPQSVQEPMKRRPNLICRQTLG
jgi:hypothetical protein